MKHNSYFAGKVQSLGVNTPAGYATVGVIEPGQYTFATDAEEQMMVIAGTMQVRLPGGSWQQIGKDETFVVPSHASFDVDVPVDVAYICYYAK